MASALSSLIPLAQTLGLTAPAFYAAITYSYNALVLPPLLSYADDETRLAKQWLLAYQHGPAFVPPLLLASAFGNGLLAIMTGWKYLYGSGPEWLGTSTGAVTTAAVGSSQLLYASIAYAIALVSFAIVGPYTLAGMEKGINGSGKWKAQLLLAPSWKDRQKGKEDERKWVMPEGTKPSAFMHSGTPQARKWAEGVTMRQIVVRWGEWNGRRIHMGLTAVLASAVGMWLRA